MTFLALILALLLAYTWEGAARVQRDDWYRGWRGLVENWSLPSGLRLALAVLVPAALACAVLDALEPALFGLLWLGFALLLLLYSLGRGDYRERLAHYRRQCRSGDFEGLFLSSGAGEPPATADPGPASPEEVNEVAQGALLYDGFQRWFPVVFYFMLLGPAGALLYRLLHLSRDGADAALAGRCLFLADWLPARLLAATFVLTGDFVGSRDELLDALQSGSREAEPLLLEVGSAALGEVPGREADFGAWAADQGDEFAALLKRSTGAWLVVISLCVVLF